MKALSPLTIISITLAGLIVFSSACATKKYVRKTVNDRVTPAEGRIDELEETARRNTQDIKALDARLSTLSSTVDDVRNRADRAQSAADQASLRAQHAEARADEVDKRVTAVDSKVSGLDEKVENLDTYSLVSTVTVNFASGSAALTPQAKAELDSLAAQIQSEKGFVLEIQGFTDKVGSPELNRALSQKRADAVRLYLAQKYNIPLHRMFVLGFGMEKPAAANNTRAGRAQNRRVEVRLLANSISSSRQRRVQSTIK